MTSTQSAIYYPMFILDDETGELSFFFTGLPEVITNVVTTFAFTKCAGLGITGININTGPCEEPGFSFNDESPDSDQPGGHCSQTHR